MIDYALKNILKRLPRSILLVCSIGLMFTLIIAITGITSYQIRTVQEHASASAGKIHVQTRFSGTQYPASVIDIPESTVKNILSCKNLQTALSAGILYFAVEPPLYPSEPPELLLVGIEPGKEQAFTGSIANDIDTISGVEFFSEVQADNPIILGKKLWQYFNRKEKKQISIGNRINLLGTDWHVIGILEKSNDKVVNNAAIVPLANAQKVLGKQGFVSSILITPRKVGQEESIFTIIKKQDQQLIIITDELLRKNIIGGIQMFEALVNSITYVVLVSSILLLMTVMFISVIQRTKEIGVLRAIGANNFRIIFSLLWEIFIICFAGTLVGSACAGFILRFCMMENLFSIDHIISFFPLTFIITLISSIVPVVRILKIQPIESLHYE